MSIIGTIHEDITTSVLGVIGRWQWLVTFVTMACMIFPTMNQHQDAILLERPRADECVVPRQDDLKNVSLCSVSIKKGPKTLKCKEWRIQLLGFIWIKRSWLMFCDPKIKALSTSLISRLGSMFGCILIGVISDSFGRKHCMKVGIVAELGFRTILLISDSESWFNLFIFLKSLFTSANIYMGIIIICEISSNVWRSQLNTIVSSPRLLAAMCVVPAVNLGPNPESFDLIVCLCCVLPLILLRWIPESPQWLLFNRKIPEAEKLLVKAAKRNGTVLGSVFQIRPVDHEAYITLDEPRTYCVGMITTYNIRVLTITLLLYWTLSFFTFSCLYIRVYRNRTDNYVFLELLSLIVSMGLLNLCLSIKIRLRKLLLINATVIGCLETIVIIISCLNFNNTLCHLLSCMSLSAAVIIHALILNITPRLLAINIRASLFGLCYSAGHLGSVVCYIVVVLNAVNDLSLMIANVAIMITLVFLCRAIPDVDGRELPDVLEDMDYFSELSKPLRWAFQKSNSSSKEEVQIRVYSFSGSIFNNSIKSHSCDRLPARRIIFIQWNLITKLLNVCKK